MACEVRSDLITVIRLVHDGMRQMLYPRHLRQHGLKHRTLMPLPLCEYQGNTAVFT